MNRCWIENAPMADELSYDDKLWCVRMLLPDWPLYHETVDEAFHALRHRPEMDKLIQEVDEDNAAALDYHDDWLVEPLSLPDICRPWTETVALLKKQAG